VSEDELVKLRAEVEAEVEEAVEFAQNAPWPDLAEAYTDVYAYTGESLGSLTMRKTTYIQAINEAMREEMRRDERVYAIGEDIGHYGGLFRVTRNMMEEFGERRVIDTPISEQGFMGMAVGAAMVGMRPDRRADVHGLLSGLRRPDFQPGGAHELHDRRACARADGDPRPARRRQTLRLAAQQLRREHFCPVPRHQGRGSLHPYDAKGLLISSIRDDNPVLFLEHKMLYFTRGDVPEPRRSTPCPSARQTSSVRAKT
jgi:hypothetical protein